MGNQLDELIQVLRKAYDNIDDMLKVKSVQKKFRESFNGASLDSSKWDSVVGSGASITQTSGQLTMASGTTANAETYVLSKEVFTVPTRLLIGLVLSQRIANQTFYVELVSVDRLTLDPDGKHCAALIFDGTTATQAKYRVQNGGYTPLDSAAVTFPTTASNSIYEVEPFADETWFHGGTLDSGTARANSYRRHQQIPDPNALYKVRLRWVNGSTPPATTTNAVMQFVAVQDYAELTCEITAGRGQSVAGQGVGVTNSSQSPLFISSNIAHDGATTSINPYLIAGTAQNALPTAVSANADACRFITTMIGVQITRPYSIPEGDWQYACTAAIANTTDVVLKAAGAAGIRNYVTAIQVKNTNATATEIVVKDGSTVIWRGHVGANMVNADEIVFPTPLKGTAATAMNFGCITTGANVYVNAQGYQAP